MTSPERVTARPPRFARARIGVFAGIPWPLGLIFALDGFVRASGIVRVPDYKNHVGASATAFGFALLCNSFGALLAMPIAGRVCERFGTHRLMVVGSVIACGAITLPALSNSIVALGFGFFFFGAVYGAAEVGLNSGAVEVETATGRTLMSPLHGLFSAGELGGAMAGALLARHLSPVVHLAVIGGLTAIAIVGLAPRLLRDGAALGARLTAAGAPAPDSVLPPASQVRPARSRSSHRMLVLGLGLVALSTAYGEGSIGDWGAIHLHEGLGVSVAAAAYGYAAFSCAITAARLVGGRIVDRLGAQPLVAAGSMLAAGGILLAAFTHSPGVAIIGYVAVGLGLANVYPVAIARAGAVAGPRGVAAASTLGLFGMLVGPALIGFVADRTSLPIGMSTVAMLAAMAVVLSRLVHTDRPAPALDSDAPNSHCSDPETSDPETSAPETSAPETAGERRSETGAVSADAAGAGRHPG